MTTENDKFNYKLSPWVGVGRPDSRDYRSRQNERLNAEKLRLAPRGPRHVHATKEPNKNACLIDKYHAPPSTTFTTEGPATPEPVTCHILVPRHAFAETCTHQIYVFCPPDQKDANGMGISCECVDTNHMHSQSTC